MNTVLRFSFIFLNYDMYYILMLLSWDDDVKKESLIDHFIWYFHCYCYTFYILFSIGCIFYIQYFYSMPIYVYFIRKEIESIKL